MSDLDDLQRDLQRLGAEAVDAAVDVVTRNTALLEASAKRHAAQPRTSPRPRTGGPEGPRLLTGSYNRSIGGRVTRRQTGARGAVGTNDVRAGRLEFGPTSGRGLSYPHMGPAMDEIEGPFVNNMHGVHIDAVRRVGHGGTITIHLGAGGA